MVFEKNDLCKERPTYHYTHLTPFEREKTIFLVNDKSVTKIAYLQNWNKSISSQELCRNVALLTHYDVPAVKSTDTI